MQNRNVFGKRNKHVNPILFILLIFMVLFSARFFLLKHMNEQLLHLENEEMSIRKQIQALTNQDTPPDILEIGDMIRQLPNQFLPQRIEQEMESALFISGFESILDMKVTQETQSPFGSLAPSSLKFIKIELRLSTDNPNHLMQFIDQITSFEKFYFVFEVEANGWDSDYITIKIILYTAYNDVDIS